MPNGVVDAGDGVSFERAFEVGGLWIAPLGSGGPPTGEIGLELACEGVFGSGLHPTTQLCLERLVELAVVPAMLDVGAGTGILGLAALRLGTGYAVLLDSDPRALEVSAANAQRNGLGARVRIESRPLAELSEQFPLVIANMPSAHLIELAPALAHRLASKGRLILSGIYETQKDDVRRAFRDLGVHAGSPTTRSGWRRLELWPSW